MRSKFKWIFTLLLAFTMQFSFAQEKTVTGTVTDGKLPLSGANVKNGSRGVQTDADGKFAIKANVGDVLTVTSIGFERQTIKVGSSNNYNVKMNSEATMLGPIVIEGYGKKSTKTKSNIAGTTITAESIEGRPNVNFVQSMQGQVAGLNIASGSGQPGSNNRVILRGVGSINGAIEPLFVIDGIILNSDNFRSINQNDIESISTLKDAAATAIYGSRGTNGVIVVTTKKAKLKSQFSTEYSSIFGFTELQKNKYDVMSTRDLLYTERNYGVGLGVGKTDAQIEALGNSVNTNWKNYFFRTGVSQAHNLSIVSGGENLGVYTSVGYLNQEGILKNTDFNRFNFRTNVSGKSINKKFTFDTNFSMNYSKRNEANSVGTGGVNQNYVLGANNSLPYVSPDMYINSAQVLNDYQNDTIYGGPLGGTLAYTPLFLIDKLNTFINRAEELKALVGTNLSYSLTKDLKLGWTGGMDLTQNTFLTTQFPGSFNSLVFQVDTEETGTQSESISRDFQFNSNLNLTYTKEFKNEQTLTASAYMEYNKSHFKSFGYTQRGLDPVYYYPGSGFGFVQFNPDTPNFYNPSVSSGLANAGMLSFFGSLDYDYKSKFGASATIRRDGSYRFLADRKWGNFYSVAGRWNIDKEAFMENSIFNMLKLRASYGTAGNADITGGGTYAGGNLVRDLSAYGNGYNNGVSYLFTQLGNPGLRWEKSSQADIGLDFAIKNNRLSGNIDVYRKKTSDLFQSRPLSAITGQSAIRDNVGSLENSGIELALNYEVIKPKVKDNFKLVISGNVAYNKNKILELPNAEGEVWGGGLTTNREGDMLNQFYLVEYAGVNPANGNLLFYDKNGVATENPVDADRRYTGKSSIPVYQGGFGFDASYKGFFLNTQFVFFADVYRFDYDLSGLQDPTNLGQFNVSNDLLRAWTPENRYTDIPSLNATNLSLDSFSDRNLKDASYLRLRSAQLGYNFPKQFLDATFIKNLRLYVQAENYLTFTKWRGWDAESTRGSDQYQYPTPKIASFGLEIKF